MWASTRWIHAGTRPAVVEDENRSAMPLSPDYVGVAVTHTEEIAINAVNVGLSALIVLLLLGLARIASRQGLEVVGARLFLKKKQAAHAGLLIIAGLATFIASNVLELYGDVYHLDWYVNEIVETVALTPMIAGLVQYRSILRLPTKAREAASLALSEAGTK